ncbi:centrosomal protein of 164 kDa [Pelodytes ibericus]
MMAIPAVRVGNQLILEEDLDESYIPQENEIKAYARLIGIDQDSEPELMWLALEGIAAPLPPQWKPCQDVTGEIYYFNFATGQSSWDHPSDELYQELVIQERKKLQTQGGNKKEKEKKKKKEKKKEKKVKDLPKPITSLGKPLGPIKGHLGGLAPLRGLGELSGIRGSMSSSAGSSGGIDSLLIGASKHPPKPLSYVKSVEAKTPEMRMSLTLPDLEEEEGDAPSSEDQSPLGSARLLKNLHMDIGSLGGGFEYEESEWGDESAAANCSDEGSEPELQRIENSEDEDESCKEVTKGFQDCQDMKAFPISTMSASPVLSHESCKMMDLLRKSNTILIPDISMDENHIDKEESMSTESQSLNIQHDRSGKEKMDFSMFDKPNSDAKSLLMEQETQDESEAGEDAKDLALSDLQGGDSLDFGFTGQTMEKVLDITALSENGVRAKKEIDEDLEEEIDEDIEEELRDKEIEDRRVEIDYSQKSPEPSSKQTSIEPIPVNSPKPADLMSQPLRNVTKPTEKLLKPAEEHAELLEHIKEEPSKLVEESVKVLTGEMELEEKNRRELQDLNKSLLKEQEEGQRKLHLNHDNRRRALEESLERETMEAEAKMKEAHKQRLAKLEKDLEIETEAEERRMRDHEQALREEQKIALEQIEKSQKEILNQKKNSMKEKLKKEIENAISAERAILLQEKESALQDLRERLKQETKEALETLEKEHYRELEKLQAAMKEKHQEALSSNKKQSQVLDYEREMRDLLQEKRQEVQREHERKLEQMKEEHKQVLEKVQIQLEEEERTQRSKMLERLQEELRSIMQLHEKELEIQRREQEKQQEERQQTYQEKENILQDMEQNQEIRRKQLMVKTNQIDCQVEDLRKRREELEEQEEEFERRTTDLKVKDNAEKEQRQLAKLVQQSQQELQEVESRKSDLEDQVELVQSRCSHLQKIASNLEEEIGRKRKDLKELNTEGARQIEEPDLRLEDLTQSSSPVPQVPAPQRTGPSRQHLPSSLDQVDDPHVDPVRHYISSQGSSIQQAKDFLRLQTRSMCRRQTLLRAAKQQWKHDMHETPDAERTQMLEGMKKSMEEEARSLDEICKTMEKGQGLLQQKELFLNDLENSLLEEQMPEEHVLKGASNRKVVTFDLSDSEDTSSMSSTDINKYDILAFQCGLSRKVQNLTDSLRHITAELNNVLTSLAYNPHSMVPIQSLTLAGLPISTFNSLNRVSTPSQLAWSSRFPTTVPMHSTPAYKYFPGGSPCFSEQTLQAENKFGYIPAEEHVRLWHNATSRVPHTDNRSVQSMIDSTKKWLEKFKNDPKVPLLPQASRTSSGAGLLQLGLDEKNEIKVFHF